jgi:hypothetical protein
MPTISPPVISMESLAPDRVTSATLIHATFIGGRPPCANDGQRGKDAERGH